MLTRKRYFYEFNLDSGTSAAKLLRYVGSGRNVLEVGCASGAQSKVLKEALGCRVTGIEIDEGSAMEARRFCEDIIVGDIEEIDLEGMLKGRRFDVITFADVLEHLKNPVKALEKVKPLLTEAGFVVASIPNIVHSALVFQMMRGNFDYSEYGLLDDTHIRFFTKKTVYRTFYSAGFAVSDLDRVSIPPSETEFKAVPRTREDRLVLDYIARNNPESSTYQFVVKAVRLDAGTQRISPDKIREMESIVRGNAGAKTGLVSKGAASGMLRKLRDVFGKGAWEK